MLHIRISLSYFHQCHWTQTFETITADGQAQHTPNVLVHEGGQSQTSQNRHLSTEIQTPNTSHFSQHGS